MAIVVKMNAINQVKKGEMLFTEGEAADGLFVLLKGKATLANVNVRLSVGANEPIAPWDVLTGVRSMSCVVEEDSSFYVFAAKGVDDIRVFLEANKECCGRFVASLGRFVAELAACLNAYVREARLLPGVIGELYRQYSVKCKEEELRSAELPDAARLAFTAPELPGLMNYYLELANVPPEIQKAFFLDGPAMAMRHICEQSELAGYLLAECERQGDFLRKQGAVLMNAGADNLFYYFCALEETAGTAGAKKAAFLLREVAEKKLEDLTAVFERYAGKTFASYKQRRMARKQGEEAVVSTEEPCENSLEQIFAYAGASEEMVTEYTANLKTFAMLVDKTSTEDEIRRLRKRLADGFYQLYEAVFRKAYGKQDRELPLPVVLFLNFGFLDEKLITRAQLLTLEKLVLVPVAAEETGSHIFTVREWLTWVFEGKREPSKNEFDQEYSEMLRDMKKGGQITAEQEAALLKDPNERLHYEIQNLFRYNHRLVNGQLSIFVPFLYAELLGSSMETSFLSKEGVEKGLEAVRRVDYSLFYREFLYMNKELGIEKEYRVAEILPDIILFPTMGSKSVLWQDISCRRRDTPGRFLLPLFAEVPVEDLLIRVSGRYRWELCRTIQGAAWNNIQVKSLTSEYTDYLMYYKKNRDISEERKEKVKAQLQKAKNSYREVFAMDYEVWMKNESTGAIKLNKVAREILATYCPFDMPIRKQLVSQPVFEEAMVRQTRERAKKIREVELRNFAITKGGAELPQELADTLAYYKNH